MHTDFMHVEFVKPRFFSQGFVTSSAFALVGLGLAGSFRFAAALTDVGFFAAGAALVAALFIYRAISLPRAAPAITLEPDALVLPRSAESARRVRVPYHDVLLIDVRGRRKPGVLIVDTRAQLLVYPIAAIANPAALPALITAVRERWRALPNAEAFMAEQAEREVLAERVLERRWTATQMILFVLAAIFVLESSFGAFSAPLGGVRFGANSCALVKHGQWFRVIAANFLHAHYVHIIMNAWALATLGGLLERMIGPTRFVIIYLVSGVAGALASTAVCRPLPSVGASTAIFGLFGALIVYNWRLGSKIPAGFRQPRRAWVATLAINAALPIVLPIIDYWGHLGGFVAGAGVAWLLSFEKPHIADLSERPLVAVFAVFCVAINAAGLGLALRRALMPAAVAQDLAAVTDVVLSMPKLEPLETNQVAWGVATNPEATEAELATAEAAAERMVREAPGIAAFIDTLATLRYRRGAFDAAVALELEALPLARSAENEDAFIATQLARFYLARDKGRPVLVGDVGAGDVTFSLAPPLLTVATERAFASGLVVTAIVRGAEPIGVLRVTLGASARTTSTLVLGDVAARWPRPVKLEIVAIDATGCGCAAESADKKFYAVDEGALRLP